MFLGFHDRSSDSPFIERVWRSWSERAGTFRSIAACHWEMVVSRHGGLTFLTVRGPETRATAADCPADGEWIGVRFRLGTFMPHLPTVGLLDRRDVTLPDLSGRAFWLDGSAWEYPGFDDAEAFVRRLVARGLVAVDPYVAAVVCGDPSGVSERTEQRHVRRATAITLAAAGQIERARRATRLLREGMDIATAAHAAGYVDQPHLTRAVRRLIGLTPAQIAGDREQLSFLYNTDPP